MALLERLARLREEFVPIAAHELRTPLTSLQLRLQSILREGGFDTRGGALRGARRALKFGRGRPVTVVVDQVGDEARLEVRDQGVGVDPETRARLFDRFWRGVSAEHFGGLGLGLYLARYIVEAHGGHVAVLDTVGRGATFVVTLPLAAQEAVARVP